MGTGTFLNQKSSQSPFSKRRMSPLDSGIAALSSKVRNDRGMDSRLRENDIKGSGNDPSEARLHGASIKGSGSIMVTLVYLNLNPFSSKSLKQASTTSGS
ncbi:hypothetical protein ES707_14338 [subsurface metagenome]